MKIKKTTQEQTLLESTDLLFTKTEKFKLHSLKTFIKSHKAVYVYAFSQTDLKIQGYLCHGFYKVSVWFAGKKLKTKEFNELVKDMGYHDACHFLDALKAFGHIDVTGYVWRVVRFDKQDLQNINEAISNLPDLLKP